MREPAAPTAAKLRWLRDTCPEVRTSSPSDRKRIVKHRPSVQSVRWNPATWGTTTSKASTTTPPPNCNGTGVVHDERNGTIRCDVASQRFGSVNSAMNRTMNGTLGGIPIRTEDVEVVRTSVRRLLMIPIARPPTYVIGRLLKAPMAAAPKACTINSVKVLAERSMLGAISNPEAAANTHPMAHAVRRTRAGDVPARSSNSALSTTPRIAFPVLVKRSAAYRTAVATSTKANVIT